MDLSQLDHLLSPELLADLQQIPIEELRTRRSACEELEAALSFLRRVVQGRLDILAAELQHRSAGEGATAVGDLVEQLKRGEILSEHVRAPGLGRAPTQIEPPELDESLTRELDAIAGGPVLAALPQLSDDEVRAKVDDVNRLERDVSGKRRALHERIDALQEELVRRYRTGEASVDSLLR